MKDEDDAETGILSDREEREKKLMLLMEEEPVLYFFIALFNLFVFFCLFLGMLLDLYFLYRWKSGRGLSINIQHRPEPRWEPGDIVRVVILFLSLGYLFAIIQGVFYSLVKTDINPNFDMIMTTGVVNLGGISVILYFVTKRYGQSIRALGLTFKRSISAMFYGLTGYIALLPVLLIIMVLTMLISKIADYQPPVQPIVEVFMEEKETKVLGTGILFAAVFGPFAEELFFRGFMYGALKKRTGAIWAMVLTSALFSALHTHLVGFLPIFALGMLLAYLYERTGSLIPSITVHIAHNVAMVLLVFIMKYLKMY
jgi:membrane protease YdiL (CAAX protease family)